MRCFQNLQKKKPQYSVLELTRDYNVLYYLSVPLFLFFNLRMFSPKNPIFH